MTIFNPSFVVTPEKLFAERLWREAELLRTDIAATVSDYPNAAAIITYRAALRDWPSTEDFPDTRPTLGS